MRHFGHVPTDSGTEYCGNCEAAEQQAKSPNDPIWCPEHRRGQPRGDIAKKTLENDVPLKTRHPNIANPRPSNNLSPDDADSVNQPQTLPVDEYIPRRPGAGRRAKGLRIYTPNPPPIGSEPDPGSGVTVFADGSLRGQPSAMWAFLKSQGRCANKNCRQEVDDPRYASCSRCRAIDNEKAKRYQAKKKARRTANNQPAQTVSIGGAPTPSVVNSEPQQLRTLPHQQHDDHDHVLGQARVQKPTQPEFAALPAWIQQELSRLEARNREASPDDLEDPQRPPLNPQDRYQRLRDELFQIVLGRAETSIAEIRAHPQQAVSQDAIDTIRLRTLDDLTAVRLATDRPIRHFYPVRLQEEIGPPETHPEAVSPFGLYYHGGIKAQGEAQKRTSSSTLSSHRTPRLCDGSIHPPPMSNPIPTQQQGSQIGVVRTFTDITNLNQLNNLMSQTSQTIHQQDGAVYSHHSLNTTNTNAPEVQASSVIDPRLFDSGVLGHNHPAASTTWNPGRLGAQSATSERLQHGPDANESFLSPHDVLIRPSYHHPGVVGGPPSSQLANHLTPRQPSEQSSNGPRLDDNRGINPACLGLPLSRLSENQNPALAHFSATQPSFSPFTLPGSRRHARAFPQHPAAAYRPTQTSPAPVDGDRVEPDNAADAGDPGNTVTKPISAAGTTNTNRAANPATRIPAPRHVRNENKDDGHFYAENPDLSPGTVAGLLALRDWMHQGF